MDAYLYIISEPVKRASILINKGRRYFVVRSLNNDVVSLLIDVEDDCEFNFVFISLTFFSMTSLRLKRSCRNLNDVSTSFLY